MSKNCLCLACIVLLFGLPATVGYSQGLLEFDGGGDGTSWSDPNNWEEVLDPNGNPGSGNPASPPGPTTFAEIPQVGVVVDPNSRALIATIGTAAGSGSASLGAGSSLDLSNDLRLGGDPNATANTGHFTMTGGSLTTSGGGDIELGFDSAGSMDMSGGTVDIDDDVIIRTDSSLTMSGGTFTVGDRLVTEDNAVINKTGGTITALDDFFFFGNSQITNGDGLMEVVDKLRFESDPNVGVSMLTINGGTVRTEEFHFNITTIDDFRGVTEINGDGVLQVIQGDGSTQSELTIRMARDLIAEGVHLTTAGAKPLGAFSVVVPSSVHGTNLTYTQISVVPEPTSALLLGLGSLGLLVRRRK